eukprot:UN22012
MEDAIPSRKRYVRFVKFVTLETFYKPFIASSLLHTFYVCKLTNQ